jgi:hypothetical protein
VNVVKNQVVRGDDDFGLSPQALAALRESLEDQRRFRQEQLRQIAETTRYRAADCPSRPAVREPAASRSVGSPPAGSVGSQRSAAQSADARHAEPPGEHAGLRAEPAVEPAEQGGPSAEIGVEPAEQDGALAEIGVKLAASARMVLADVEAALERMDRGCYGACHLCTRLIPLDLLTIVPQARYCARCHRVRETGR